MGAKGGLQMKTKKRWIIWIIIIEILIAISLWTNIKYNEKYDKRFYDTAVINSESYEKLMNDEEYIIIKNNIQYLKYVKKLNSVGRYTDTRFAFSDEEFYSGHSVIITNLKLMPSWIDLISVDLKDKEAEINIKYTSKYSPDKISELETIYFIPIESKTIETVSINVSTLEIYNQVSNVCKIASILLSLIMIICAIVKKEVKNIVSSFSLLIIILFTSILYIAINVGQAIFECSILKGIIPSLCNIIILTILIRNCKNKNIEDEEKMTSEIIKLLLIFLFIEVTEIMLIFAYEINIIIGFVFIAFLISIMIIFSVINQKYDKIENESIRNDYKNKLNKKMQILRWLVIISVIVSIVVLYTMATQPMDSVDKPVIYLYPEQETEVEVKVTYPEKLTCTYPKYEESWKVLATPSGDLTDLETGRSLYCLYYEAEETIETSKDEGFIVKREDTISFLEEKLEILGLTERESNEFIIYWLPKLEASPYNFIRFQTIEEINENMPLEITPTPDTVIRVMMEYKALDEYKEIKEQYLTTPIREGFTVVEWGGTEIK